MPPRWEVIGGQDKGGILVRTGADLKSTSVNLRLAKGSIVEELETCGDRLHYQLVEGNGPSEGWVTLRTAGKELLASLGGPLRGEIPDTWKPPLNRDVSAANVRESRGLPHKVLGLEHGASSSAVRRAYHCLALLHHPDKGGDALMFEAVADAYRSLTEAKDELGGWRDLEGQAVGPWHAHTESTKGITCMLFDLFGEPPWESRRLYTGSWQESSLRCWELSKGEPGKDRPPPRLLGEIRAGGFLNDVAAISPYGMITAQSAGMKPLPGESLRIWNLKKTPFKTIGSIKARAIRESGSTSMLADVDDSESMMEDNIDEEYEEGDLQINTSETLVPSISHLDDMSQMVELHHRGVRAISLWPRPEDGKATPYLAGTVSKDVIAVSNIGADGCSLDVPVRWGRKYPHKSTDVTALRHEMVERMWSGDQRGLLKCWDTTDASTNSVIMQLDTKSGWMTGIEVFPGPGVLVASHSNGLTFVDTKAGKVIRKHTTKNPAGKVRILNGDNPMMFAGIGSELMQYDTRLFRDGHDSKPAAVGQWTVSANITAMHCAETRQGHLLVAVGCCDGKVAAFDTS